MNSDKLQDKVKDRGYSVIGFIRELNNHGINMSKNSYYRKLNGDTEYTRTEILGIRSVLKLTNKEVQDIFFKEEVS